MSDPFDRLVQLMAKLRAPDGCPWDRKQTHESLKPYLLEETYEVLESIDGRESGRLREELGDVLLQVIFHAQIGAEERTFTIQDVIEHLSDKLVRRHPHVFATVPKQEGSMTPDQVYHRWEQIKREERQNSGASTSVLDGVPKTLPALLRAYQHQARTSRVGFDWPKNRQGLAQVFGKVREEIGELEQAVGDKASAETEAGRRAGSHDRIEAELGDLFFSLVNLSRRLKINPEDALRRATDRFTERFRFVEQEAAKAGRPLESMKLEELDALWERAKQQEHRSA